MGADSGVPGVRYGAVGAATSGDAGDIDVGRDAASPGDGGNMDTVDATAVDAVDVEDISLDSPVVMPDADAGSAPVPVFSACTFVASIGHVPSAIIDAAGDLSGLVSQCACTLLQRVTIHRVLCGPSVPSIDVSYSCGGPPPPVVQRSIIILDWFKCPAIGTLDSGVFWNNERPLTDWDALLAEQIAGHTDGGSDGGATVDAAAEPRATP
jgi:hypothetical protein